MKFREGKIIEIFYVEKKGKKVPVIFRYPKKSDVKQIWKFYNKVIKETEFLSRITPVSLEDEKKWFAGMIKEMGKGNKIQLLAECEGKIVGSCSIERKASQRLAHVGGFGICILQEFTGLGIGKRMMIVLEKDARKINLRILELSVCGRNKIAQNLYRKMRFKVAGKIPNSVKIRKGFDDDIIMYKVLKK